MEMTGIAGIVSSILTILGIAIYTHWSIITIYVLLGAIGFLLYRPRKSNVRARNVEICIVSKASNCVKHALFECIRENATRFKDYRINVIVDEGAELLGELREYIKQFPNVRLIVVPNTFKCNAIAKGRAIEYFIRYHVEDDKWYAFIDDDNIILDDTFLYEIPYYEARGYVAANGILYPRCGKSKLTYVADFLRYFDDLTIFRVCTGLFGKPFNGFHEELLLAKGRVLKEITFDRKSITEDFAFARELIKRGYKTWQSATKISILSPHSIKDFLRQRNRWYRGISRDIWEAPLGMWLVAGIRIFDWKIGIIGSWAFAPLWIFIPAPLAWKLFCLIGALYYYAAYIYGAMHLKGIVNKIKYILLIPVYSVLETIAPHIRVKNSLEFTVINK